MSVEKSVISRVRHDSSCLSTYQDKHEFSNFKEDIMTAYTQIKKQFLIIDAVDEKIIQRINEIPNDFFEKRAIHCQYCNQLSPLKQISKNQAIIFISKCISSIIDDFI